MNMDEYVPATIPINNKMQNSLMLPSLNRIKDIMTKRVVMDVLRVRDKV